MNGFDLLSLASAIGVAVSVVRRRPALLILGGNQLVVLRALSNIQKFGPPASQDFVPLAVFAQRNLDIAEMLMGLFAAMTLVAVLVTPRGCKPLTAATIPRLPRWVFIVVIAYMVVAFFASATLATKAYENGAWTIAGVNLGGAKAFLISLFLYEIFRVTACGRLSPVQAFLIVFATFFLTDYAKGSTGLASGYILTGAVLLLGETRAPVRRTTLLLGALAAMAVSAALVRTVRADFYADGADALTRASQSLATANSQVGRTAEGVESSGNGAQYAAHLLECITLYEAGISREWRSIINPLIYTFEPAFLLDPLGIERPLDAPWELGRYFIHGGGIFIVGDMYWNGGVLCLLLVGGLLVIFCFLCDTRYRNNIFWLMMACHFTPGLLQGAGYGLAQVSRGAFNGLLMFGIYYFSRRRIGATSERSVRSSDETGTDRVACGRATHGRPAASRRASARLPFAASVRASPK